MVNILARLFRELWRFGFAVEDKQVGSTILFHGRFRLRAAEDGVGDSNLVFTDLISPYLWEAGQTMIVIYGTFCFGQARRLLNLQKKRTGY
jgi:hypothetical protein